MEWVAGVGAVYANVPFVEVTPTVSVYDRASWDDAKVRPFVTVTTVLYRRPQRVYVPMWQRRYLEAGNFPLIELWNGETPDAALRRLCAGYLGFTPSDDPARYTEIGTYSYVHDPGRGERVLHFVTIALAYRMRTREAPKANRQADGRPPEYDVFTNGHWINTHSIVATRDWGVPMADMAADFLSRVAPAQG